MRSKYNSMCVWAQVTHRRVTSFSFYTHMRYSHVGKRNMPAKLQDTQHSPTKLHTHTHTHTEHAMKNRQIRKSHSHTASEHCNAHYRNIIYMGV